MFKALRKWWPGSTARVDPQYDETVRLRLEAEGKSPAALIADAAEPVEIPPKPSLTGFQGMIRFEMTLGAEGDVRAVQMEGAPFNQVAELEAWAYAWTFRPARLEGKTHPCRMVYEVHWS